MIDKLNERITIQQSKHMTDKVGNHRNAWVDYYTCFAYASTHEATEEDGEVTAEQKSVVFTVRWCSEVNKLTSTGFRVLFRGELYDIRSVDPMNFNKKTTKLHCRLERRQRLAVKLSVWMGLRRPSMRDCRSIPSWHPLRSNVPSANLLRPSRKRSRPAHRL